MTSMLTQSMPSPGPRPSVETSCLALPFTQPSDDVLTWHSMLMPCKICISRV